MKLTHKILLTAFISVLILVVVGFFLYSKVAIPPLILGGIGLFVFFAILYFLLEKHSKELNTTIGLLKEQNSSNAPLSIRSGDTVEVQNLNKVLNDFMTFNHNRFNEQKQYSENLSHELLTPLTVIRNKAELLMQNPKLSESDLISLDSILNTVSRLSKVNQGLILLSKISNNQFLDKEKVDLKELVHDSLENFEDQIQKKQISIRINLAQGELLNTNPNLLRVLIKNLVKNAVFHNIEKGNISIGLKENKLVIENSGHQNTSNSEDYFNRFVSRKKSIESIGLGLAIAKQICAFLNYNITYESEEAQHKVTVRF